MKELFDIGIVTGVHGIKGDIKIFPYSNDSQNLINQKYFMADGVKRYISYARIQDKYIIVHLEGTESREDAEALKNTIFSLPRELAAPLGEGQYYMDDIIGCRVYEGEKYLGIVDDIIETGANDVYSVIAKDKSELLIPALKSVIQNIQIELKRIDVILPEGLVDNEYF